MTEHLHQRLMIIDQWIQFKTTENQSIMNQQVRSDNDASEVDLRDILIHFGKLHDIMGVQGH